MYIVGGIPKIEKNQSWGTALAESFLANDYNSTNDLPPPHPTDMSELDSGLSHIPGTGLCFSGLHFPELGASEHSDLHQACLAVCFF